MSGTADIRGDVQPPDPDVMDELVADLVVVGLGPAGAACLLQGVREGLRVVGVADEPIGGLLVAARRLDNLPGWPGGARGPELAERIAWQVAASGATVLTGRVTRLRREGTGFQATLESGRVVDATTVCVATGTVPGPLPWPMTGLATPHRDARTLPADLGGCTVLVVGAGDAAFDTALTARDRGASVTILSRGQGVRAASGLVAEAARAGIGVRTGVTVAELAWGEGRWRLDIEGEAMLQADHLVACIGRRPRRELLTDMGVTEDSVRLPMGCFLAGDVGRSGERFAAVAMGDGQLAALAAASMVRVERAGKGD